MPALKLLTVVTLFSCKSLLSCVWSKKDIGFVAPLIHRTSPQSPFYNQYAKHEDLIRESILISRQRSQYISQLIKGGNELSMKFAIAPISKEFVMNFSIGTPPLQTFAIPDTGSSLFWVQCRPCGGCHKQEAPFYDSRKSSSYKRVTCGSTACNSLNQFVCTSDGYCSYSMSYWDNSFSRGIVSLENFILKDSESSGSITLQEIIFGCGTNNFDTTRQGIPGVVGLGYNTVSLMGQLKFSSFSYCTKVDENGYGGWIRFGSAAVFMGESTSLIPSTITGHYFLTLESISVGGQEINLPEDLVYSGLVIDSGCTYSELHPDALDELIKKVKMYMSDHEMWTDDSWELCYEDIFGAPEIEFVFEDFHFPLSDKNAWVLSSHGLLCLAIFRAKGTSILGMYQQKDINVGYDLQNKKLTMQYVDACP